LMRKGRSERGSLQGRSSSLCTFPVLHHQLSAVRLLLLPSYLEAGTRRQAERQPSGHARPWPRFGISEAWGSPSLLSIGQGVACRTRRTIDRIGVGRFSLALAVV